MAKKTKKELLKELDEVLAKYEETTKALYKQYGMEYPNDRTKD